MTLSWPIISFDRTKQDFFTPVTKCCYKADCTVISKLFWRPSFLGRGGLIAQHFFWHWERREREEKKIPWHTKEDEQKLPLYGFAIFENHDEKEREKKRRRRKNALSLFGLFHQHERWKKRFQNVPMEQQSKSRGEIRAETWRFLDHPVPHTF